MKKSLLSYLVVVLFSATNHSIGNIVGYVNQVWPAGTDMLIANPLDDGVNKLSSVMPHAPNGTTVSLWDSSANAFVETSERVSGIWTMDFEMLLGIGFLLNSPMLYTNTYVGEVRTGDGVPPIGDIFFPPSPFSQPDGVYLLAAITPMSGDIDFMYEWVVGRPPQVGEQVSKLDPAVKTTYLGDGLWTDPTFGLGVAESAFFSIGPAAVPDGGATLGLLGLGSLALVAMRRRP